MACLSFQWAYDFVSWRGVTSEGKFYGIKGRDGGGGIFD